MPRLRNFIEERRPAPQGRVAWSEVVRTMLAWRDAVDRMERRYALSERCHIHIYGVLNNQYEPTMGMSVVGSKDDPNGYSSSEWPNTMTPSELIRLSEIRAVVGQWETGELESLPPSTFEFPALTAKDFPDQ